MRITGGALAGRRLRVPAGDVRPTSERVREALFGILADELEGARVLDLCAGTGALGLEALSRGAAHVVFAERSHRALAALRENLATLAPENAPAPRASAPASVSTARTSAPADGSAPYLYSAAPPPAAPTPTWRVLAGDLLRVLPRLRGTPPFDLALLDPPYASTLAPRALALLAREGLLGPGARVVVESDRRAPPGPVAGFALGDARRYGDTLLTFYRFTQEARGEPWEA